MELPGKVEKSLQIIEVVAKECGGFDKLALSFNGGKDCTVMLHLFKIALRRNGLGPLHPIKMAYVRPQNPIPLVDEFVVTVTEDDPSLHLFTYAHPIGMKEAFGAFTLDEEIEGVLVGVRRSDPYGDRVVDIMRTDSGWPDFIRVHPLLDWTYHDVWNFILEHRIPYCKLYDMGYSSIGDLQNSRPNPNLVVNGRFLHPWELNDESQERTSRL